MAPKAVIFGCAGLELTSWEAEFFAAADPLGFILFARNCETPEQVSTLVADLRQAVGRNEAPVLIDQEGGRVQRLKPPHWRAVPAPGRFGDLACSDRPRALDAVRLNARCLAAELAPLGITVDCLPLLDLRLPGAHDVVGDRGFSDDPDLVAALGRACCEGLMEGGLMPVIKHMPGHGRALVDSHAELPRVEAPLADLEGSDFLPFRALADMPWGMTGHIVIAAVDPRQPATRSPEVIARIIRGWIGFDGVLVSDDLSMQALEGDLGARAAAALDAGCDLALHCNGDRAEMEAVAAVAPPLDTKALRRLAAAADRVGPPPQADAAALAAELDALLAGA